MKKIIACLMMIVTTTAASGQREVSLSVYHDDFALVKDQRTLDLDGGVTEFRFTDVAATIDPTSVRFTSKDDPEARIVEQNFQFDLVEGPKLLGKYIDHSVSVLTQNNEVIEGTLLQANDDTIILKTTNGIQILIADQVAGVKLTELPEGLLTRPTLVWQIYAPEGGKQTIQLDYLAKQIKWAMNYNAVLAEDEKTLNLDGWVTLTNNSGTSFENAAVTLIAGSPTKPQKQEYPDWQYRPQLPPSFGIDYFRSLSPLAPGTQRGEETAETFGEYHLYRLPEKTNVNAGQVKQIKLIQARDVPVEKFYLYDGSKTRFIPFQKYIDPRFGLEENTKVNVILAIENRGDRNLGVALPPGLARIFKRDKDQSLEFVGEDKVPATSVDERVLLYIGDAFDLVGKRTQTNFNRISQSQIEETFEIELKNHKSEPVTILVIEKLYRGSNWQIRESSEKYQKLDSRTIRFDVSLNPDETRTIEYTVRYQW